MIRNTITRKYLLVYGLIGLFLLLVFNTAGSYFIQEKLMANKKTELSAYTQYIKNQHFEAIIDSNTIYNTTAISNQIASTDEILHTRTWIVNADGDLLLDSGNDSLRSGAVNILQYDAAYFHHYFYQKRTLQPLLAYPMLSVILPVSGNLHIAGYIVVHYPMEAIEKQTAHYQQLGNGIGMAILCLLGLCFCFNWILTIRPLKKLLHSVSCANQGDYQTTLTLKQRDEFGALNTEINYMKDQLKNLDNYQKHFIANVSHDFRSPLTSIRGYAVAMQDGTIPPELHGKYLDVITFEVDRLTKLTSDLLSINQFEQGGHLLDLVSFDINQVIKRTATTFEGTCTQKHIKLKLSFSEKETYVNADESKIQQVLYNLIDNAIKFSNPDSEIFIKTWEKKEKVLISVKDFGIGIPKDGIKKIWERFYKTDLSRGKDKKGTGLGLSITKEIITAHGEHINVTSTEGAGTEFTFTLPLTHPDDI